MAMEITQCLLSAQSADAKVRTDAENGLRQFQEQNLPAFLLSLSVELANNEKPIESRKLAGIVLKNSLDAKESARKEQLVQQWVAIDGSVKSQVKELLLRTLWSSVPEARHTSAQVIAKVASIEIPRKQWPELIGSLLLNMTQQDSLAALKQATLETLGYVCEEISHEDLAQDEVNSVLTAVVQGMNLAEHSPEVRLAATRALYNALDFAQTNFENEMERNYILKVVCETALSKETEIRQAAFECLVSIASTYYEVLEPYMQTLYELTSNAVKGDEEAVALQAIEFWSSICDEEIELQEYGGDESGDSAPHSHFVEKALSSLVPMLLETLLKQEEDQDQDDGTWNLSMAGGTCLGLVSRTVGDAIVPLVVPFVQSNIIKTDWRGREAATYAFGSILEGPSTEKLAPLVNAGLEFLLNAMRDENSHVKDTTAWTLSRIFELLHSPVSGFSVISHANLQTVLGVLIESLKDSSNVAEKVCGAIYYLAQGYEDTGTSTSLLSPYLPEIIRCLIIAAERTDVSDMKLRSSAYETLNEVVRCSNIAETSQIVAQLLPVIMEKLGQTIDIPILSSDDREKQGDLQALLCGVLQVIIQKLSSTDETKAIILQAADQIMILFLKVFACRSSTVHEEAMLAIGALAYATGPEFAKYMSEFYKYLEMGLQNFEEYQVCAISVGVVGDICRALDDKILPYCDGIMTHLLKDLSSNDLHRSVKPAIFSCFGDVALAISEHFEKYLPYAIPMLQGAVEICVRMDTNDEEMMEYGNQLRRSIFEAYSGILQGFKTSKSDLMLPYAAHLLQFIELVSRDKNRDESVTKAAVAVLGDLADALGANMKLLFKEKTFCSEFLGECLESEDEQLKETATWTQGMIGRLWWIEEDSLMYEMKPHIFALWDLVEINWTSDRRTKSLARSPSVLDLE
ncbi:Importin-beta, N-terminal domain [Dillenia turbinata]|uniref:Importin-beta, N-terminal domain n=1 Tax=Dillenia turbinata TaxID=194707 RepID=A0AAN8VZW8_9MAGN